MYTQTNMELLFHLIIFIIILLFYIHITNQCNTSEDLEIYELNYTDNKYLQEVCDVKQPTIFNYKDINPDFFSKFNKNTIEDFDTYDIKIKDNRDYFENSVIDFVYLPFRSASTLMNTDSKSNYFTEDNHTFIDDANLTHIFKTNDMFLKPYYTIQTKYDYISGSKKSYLPFRFHKHNRYFVAVHSGNIRIKLSPYKSSKYLHTIYDYDCYEFRSPINIWEPQRHYFNEMNKMKFLEFDVNEGQIIYIPSYWWYSIMFLDSSTVLSGITYNNIISTISNSKDIGLYYLQQSNTITKVANTFENHTIINNNDNNNENNENNDNDDKIMENDTITEEITNKNSNIITI